MSTGPASGGYHTSEDEQTLHKLGYAQELFRAAGRVPELRDQLHDHLDPRGVPDLVLRRLRARRPVAVTWGWLIVGLFSTIIALAMAEIASAYPTAGGLYYWASKLGSPGWGWATGWFNLIGQVAVTAAIGYGLATFGTVLFDYWFSYSARMNDWFGFSANTSIFVLYAIFLLAAALINMFNIRITAGLNTISAYWHMVGVALHRARPDHRPERPPVVRVRLRRDRQRLRLRQRGRQLLQPGVLVRVRPRPAALAVHDHRLRRVGAHRRGDAEGLAHGGCRHVHVGRRLRRLRLDPAARRDVRDPQHRGRAREHRRRSSPGSGPSR